MIQKPASESRTLRFNRLATIVTAVAAFVPTILSYAIAALGDPQIAAAVAQLVPPQHRALILLVVAFIAQRNAALRLQTSTPIQGSAGAAELEATTRTLGVTGGETVHVTLPVHGVDDVVAAAAVDVIRHRTAARKE